VPCVFALQTVRSKVLCVFPCNQEQKTGTPMPPRRTPFPACRGEGVALGLRFTSNRTAPLILTLIHPGTNRRSVKLPLPHRIHRSQLLRKDVS
jgi:hypothetical protein